MAKTVNPTVDEKPKDEPSPSESTTALVPKTDVTSLFARATNSKNAIKSMVFKKSLTRPLISMGKLKQLAVECASEMYAMDLPLSGRGSGSAPARVVDVVDLENGEECILIIHSTMASAIQRAGYKVLNPVIVEGKTERYVETEGAPLKGHAFAFRTLALKGDKGYHMIETVEIEVTR